MRYNPVSLLCTDQLFSVINYMLCSMTRFTNIHSLVPTSDLDQNFHLWVMQELRDLVLMM